MKEYDLKYGAKTSDFLIGKEEIYEKNTANINLLNNYCETAVFLADKEMQQKLGWQK